MKKLLAIMLAGIIMIGSTACTGSNSGESQQPADNQTEAAAVQTMTGQELVDLMGDTEKAANTIVVDVRKADEFAAGHIDGAVNIALEDIEAKLGELEAYKDKNVVLYCNTGNRSGKAGDLLVEKGFMNVYNADGVKKFEYNLVTGEAAPMKAEVQTMTGQELVDLMGDAEKAANTIIVDVRKADEFAAGHIDGAVHIALEDIEAKLGELEAYKDKNVVLYCNTGNRSGKAGDLLVEKGFMNVYNADGVKEFEYDLVK